MQAVAEEIEKIMEQMGKPSGQEAAALPFNAGGIDIVEVSFYQSHGFYHAFPFPIKLTHLPLFFTFIVPVYLTFS